MTNGPEMLFCCCRGYLGDVELAAPLLALSREPDVEVAARVSAGLVRCVGRMHRRVAAGCSYELYGCGSTRSALQYTAPVDAVLLLNASADLIGYQIGQASNERRKHWVLPFSPSTCSPPRRRACWPTWRSTFRR